MARRKVSPRTVRRQVKVNAGSVNERADYLSDPLVQRMLAEAFAQGARLAARYPSNTMLEPPVLDEDGVSFDHSAITPPRRRGRPTRFETLVSDSATGRVNNAREHPEFCRIMDDLEILTQYQIILGVLRKEPVKRHKDEDFDEWVNRLMPVARQAWESFAMNLGADPIYGTKRASVKEPLVVGAIPLPDDRLRVLVTRSVNRIERRRDADRSRLAYRLLAHRWNVSTGFIRSRIQAARNLGAT